MKLTTNRIKNKEKVILLQKDKKNAKNDKESKDKRTRSK